MLKKEFKQKDVNRARNLIMGKTDASTSTQIGYNTKQKDYKEGDVWTEGRKTWTIKNAQAVALKSTSTMMFVMLVGLTSHGQYPGWLILLAV